jgi:hypothetical protein
MIDLAYCTVANGDGQTTAAREAALDVGGDPGPAARRRPSVLRATESDPRPARLRRVCRRAVPPLGKNSFRSYVVTAVLEFSRREERITAHSMDLRTRVLANSKARMAATGVAAKFR